MIEISTVYVDVICKWCQLFYYYFYKYPTINNMICLDWKISI